VLELSLELGEVLRIRSRVRIRVTCSRLDVLYLITLLLIIIFVSWPVFMTGFGLELGFDLGFGSSVRVCVRP
jgi:hypothetical protein